MRRLRIFCSVVLLVALVGLPYSAAAFAQPDDTQNDAQPADDAEDPATEDDDEEVEEMELPKLEDMQLPSAEELLQGQPVDWLVLPNEDVVVIEPVSLRPETVKKMEERLRERLTKPLPDDSDAALRERRERDRLRYLEIVLAENVEQPEYWVHMKDIQQIIYHEDLVLRRVDKLLDEGELEVSFEMLYVLTRRTPEWPGLEARRNRHLFASARQRSAEGFPERALALLQELYRRDPDYTLARPTERLTLQDEFGKVCDKLISTAIEKGDFRRARHFLGRLRRRYPQHEVAARVSSELQARCARLLEEATAASGDGRHAEAASLADRAARVWPADPNLRSLHTRFNSRYQRVKAGVVTLGRPRPADEIVVFQDDKRTDRLRWARLFQPDFAEGAIRFRSAFLESWEPTDLGRRMTFHLRRGRADWESRPVMTAAATARLLESRLTPGANSFDPRMAALIRGFRVTSPFEIEVQFRRAPVRPEPFFRLPVAASGDGAGTRFRIGSEGENEIRFQRAVPEPDSTRNFHVAEVVETRYPDAPEAVRALLRGDVSMIPRLSPWDVGAFADEKQLVARQYATPALHLLQWNFDSPTHRNRELRRALSLAVDREKILKETLLRDAPARYGRVAESLFPEGSYARPRVTEPPRHDVGVAYSLALAARRTFKDKQLPVLKLRCDPDPITRAAAARLIAQWKRVGIEVELVDPYADSEWDILYRRVRLLAPLTDMWPLLTLEPTGNVEDLATLPDWLRRAVVDLDRVANMQDAVSQINALEAALLRDAHLIALWEVDQFLVARDTIQGIPDQPVWAYDELDRWVVEPWYPTEAP